MNGPIPCRVCAEPTMMTGTKLCDRCWEVERAVSHVYVVVVDGKPIAAYSVERLARYLAGFMSCPVSVEVIELNRGRPK